MYLENIASILEESLDEALQLDIRITYAFDQTEEDNLFAGFITEGSSTLICAVPTIY